MNEREQRDWQALRYVLGELPDADARCWEKRLADDQPAREAVADAVELVQCVNLVETERGERANVPVTPIGRQVRAASYGVGPAWAAGAGGVLVVVLALSTLMLPQPAVTQRQATPALPAVDQQLAIIWGENHESLDDPLWPSEHFETAPDDLPAAEADLELTPSDASQGSWIREAVWGLVQQADGDARTQDEEL